MRKHGRKQGIPRYRREGQTALPLTEVPVRVEFKGEPRITGPICPSCQRLRVPNDEGRCLSCGS